MQEQTESNTYGAEWYSTNNAADNPITNQNWESANQNPDQDWESANRNQNGAWQTAQTETWASNQPIQNENWESANQNQIEGWENVQFNQDQQAWESTNQNDAWQSAQPDQTGNHESAQPDQNQAWPASDQLAGGEGDAWTESRQANHWETVHTNNDQVRHNPLLVVSIGFFLVFFMSCCAHKNISSLCHFHTHEDIPILPYQYTHPPHRHASLLCPRPKKC